MGKKLTTAQMLAATGPGSATQAQRAAARAQGGFPPLPGPTDRQRSAAGDSAPTPAQRSYARAVTGPAPGPTAAQRAAVAPAPGPTPAQRRYVANYKPRAAVGPKIRPMPSTVGKRSR